MSTYRGGYGLGSAYRIAPSISQTRTFNLTQPARYSPPGVPYTGVALPFSETWTGADGSVWPAEWAHNTIAGSTIQSNTGQITAGPGGGYDGALSRLAWIPNIVDTEVLVDVTAVSVGVEQYPQVALRTGPDSSTTRPSAGYSLFLCYAATPSSSFLQIERQPGGTVLGTPAFTLTGGVTYRVRFKAVGADLSVKVWDASTTEPGTWTWTLTDSSPYLTAGSVTLGQGNGADGVARSARFDNFTVSVPTAAEVHTTTGTGSATASATGAASSTRTKTATATATATATRTGASTRTKTATATATATATRTGTTARTKSGTASATAAASGLTATARPKTGTGTATATGSGTTTSQRVKTGTATATATASGTTSSTTGAVTVGTATATAAASGVTTTTRTKTGTATTAATGTAVTTTTRARTATASATASVSATTASGRTTARTATATASAYAATATVRAKTGVATLTAGATALTTTWRTIEATATAYATASGITGQGSGYRDITVSIGRGSRSDSVAGDSPRARVAVISGRHATVHLGARLEQTTTGAAPRARISIGPRE